MDKLIVVGVDTLAGAGVAQALKDRCEVLGISFQRGVECRRLFELDPSAAAIAVGWQRQSKRSSPTG